LYEFLIFSVPSAACPAHIIQLNLSSLIIREISCSHDGEHEDVFWDVAPCGVAGVAEAGFWVLTAVSTKMAVLWVVAPCRLVEVYES
jgi:hypothetical protein